MDIPPRTVTDRYLARRGRQLDVTFDVDVGELVRGHHVVARGIMLGRPVTVRRPDRGWQARRMTGGDPANGGWLMRAAEIPVGAPETMMTEAELHYEFVPGLAGGGQHGFSWSWMVYAQDDLGTVYADNNGGAFDPDGGGMASHGTRDLGGQIPAEAALLTLRFEPAGGWVPPEPWRREVVVDLRAGRLVG